MSNWIKNEYGLILTLLGAVGAVIAYAGAPVKIATYWDNYNAKKSLYFESSDYGVLVCVFDGETEYKKYASKEIVNAVNARFRELKLRNAIAKRDRYVFLNHIVSSHDEANELGLKYDADLVVWGSVSSRGVQPNIRIVDGSEQFRMYSATKEMTIFKKSLQNVANDNIAKNISFAGRRPDLTDETVSLVSFAIAVHLKKNEKFDEAIKYFYRSMPIDKTSYITNEPTYIQIAMCYYLLGNFKKSEEIILNHTYYQNNPSLLAFVGVIRYLQDSMPKKYYKKIVDVWMHSSPKDWEFLDRIFIYGITSKIFTSPPARKKDKVDLLITTAIHSSPTQDRSWKFLKLLTASKEKNYKLFKKIYAELFETADVDERMILSLQAISVDIDLADESISRIRETAGTFPGLNLLEALKCISEKKYSIARQLIEITPILEKKSLLGRTILSAYYSEEGNYDKALTYLDSLVKELPSAGLYRKLRGDINYYLGKQEAAKTDYEIYIKEYPNNTKVLYRLVTISNLNKDTGTVLKYTQKMFECPSDKELKFYPIIESVLINAPLEKANTFVDPNHEALLKDAFRLLNKNDPESAKKLLLTDKYTEPDTVRRSQFIALDYYTLAMISILEGDFLESLRYLFESYAEYPMEESKNMILSLSNEISNESKSETLFSVAAKAFKKKIQSKFSESAIALESASEQYPDFCFLRVEAGNYRLSAKEFGKAATNFQAALQCEPRMQKVNSLYASLHVHFLKDPDCASAIEYYQRSLEVDGETVAAYDGLEQCYEKLGNQKKVKEFHKKYKDLYFKNGGNPTKYFFNQPLRHL